MLALFDSIDKGYPVGSLLLWETPAPIQSIGMVGCVPVAPSPSSSKTSYVLDGHQRLSTLFSCLSPESSLDSGTREWWWEIYCDLSVPEGDRTNRFRHWRSAVPPPASYMSLRHVLRTMDFLGFARRLEAQSVKRSDVDAFVATAEVIAQRIKSYRFAVVRIVGGTLSEAVEIFSRLNSSGQSMTADQMVSALTFSMDGPSLADGIDQVLEDVARIGFGQLPRPPVFRAALAVSGERDIQDARWETIAQRLGGRIGEVVESTSDAVAQAVEFLQTEVGVPLARLIPYGLQTTLLAAYFHHAAPEQSDENLSVLRTWFWATSWSGWFAGANTTQVKEDLEAMVAFASGSGTPTGLAAAPQGFPESFDLRSARVRTLLIWFLRDRVLLDPSGNEFDARGYIAALDTDAFRQVIRDPRAARSHPANRVVLPTDRGVSVRAALIALAPENVEAVCESHLIPLEALDRLRQGNNEDFVRLRTDRLAASERSFMTEVGVVAESTLSTAEDLFDSD
ncbi:MAG: hypothetical protein JWN46_1989 [Acidimicrobiales bacterium]|nr:hypothetical protein [Acidimicrobiales bacterium]